MFWKLSVLCNTDSTPRFDSPLSFQDDLELRLIVQKTCRLRNKGRIADRTWQPFLWWKPTTTTWRTGESGHLSPKDIARNYICFSSHDKSTHRYPVAHFRLERHIGKSIICISYLICVCVWERERERDAITWLLSLAFLRLLHKF